MNGRSACFRGGALIICSRASIVKLTWGMVDRKLRGRSNGAPMPKLMHSASTKSGSVDQPCGTNHAPNGRVNMAVQEMILL